MGGRDVKHPKGIVRASRNTGITRNFGIIYGMSELGLADTLGIEEEEAKQYIAGYFDAYPVVCEWMDGQKDKINKVMYTETMKGRKRRLYPEMKSGQRWLFESAYRMGINHCVQGSSADMTKMASIQLEPVCAKYDSHMLLWVHDEIIFDVPENIGMDALREFAEVMCNALPLDCGLKSDIEAGRKWGQKMSEEELEKLTEVA